VVMIQFCNHVQFICLLHLYRSLPPKKKGQPKNKRRKTAGRNNSVEEGSGAVGNDSDSSSSLAHSDVDKDVTSGTIA
jgi:sister-chromatid-cohesion protein PDS5